MWCTIILQLPAVFPGNDSLTSGICALLITRIYFHRQTQTSMWGVLRQFFFLELTSELLDNRIYACGTLRNHLPFPDELKPLTKGNLVVSIWQDNRPVAMLSINAQALQLWMCKGGKKMDLALKFLTLAIEKLSGAACKGTDKWLQQ